MEQNKKFIKFVIPCWGIENTIGRMLDSILAQTFTDYHIVCVEDCSPDKTWQIIQDYKKRFPDKITLIKNPNNLGAGESRNIGVQQTKDSLPCEYLWVVDGDDWIADKSVLQKIYDFAKQNPQFDIINLGWTFRGKYEVARCGWPVGLPGRVIRPNVYVQGVKKNIPQGNDVYSHFVMFDQVDDSKIGALDYKCYICPEPGRHRNSTVKGMNAAKEVGMALMQHRFKKQSVVDAMKNPNTGMWDWIKRAYPEFNPIVEKPATPVKSRKVSILMASFPFRKKWMIQCIERLLPQCDNFYLWLNEYKEIPQELKKFDQNKLHITIGDVNMKECGRYTFLQKPELQNDYCFICDDDINWPKDYVKNTLECFKRHGDNIVSAYYMCDGIADFVAEHRQDDVKHTNMGWVVPHHRIGAGTMAFVPNLIRFQFTKEELLANYDIEMFMGKQCFDCGIKVYSPKRCRNWLTFISNNDQTIDKYALHLNGTESRIKYTYEYLKNKRSKVTAIGLDDLSRHSYVISIDKVRLQRFNKVFQSLNLALPNVFSGVKIAENKPQFNCYLSHRNAILKAKEQNWPYVCIFEDDAYPMTEINKKLQVYLSRIPKDCAILILGNSMLFNKTYHDELFYKNISCFGAHAYVVFREYYDKVLQCLDQKHLADWFQFKEDSFIKKSQIYMTKENLFIQYCDKKSMNKHFGYIWRNENGTNYTNAQIFKMGFSPIEDLLNKTTTQDKPIIQKQSSPIEKTKTISKRRGTPLRNFMRYWHG